MSDVVIKVENVGKQYHLGKVGTGTIANDLNRWWQMARGKEDPYLKIGDTNDRTQKSSNNDVVWAIKDISFEVKQGEVLGIIGKNGSGKSTLLKILSRVTAPTIGDIKVKGRIASLLEVGTGFHPDLSGRENIFLNGAILGMTKKEIKSKFDEIVEFSGVERYIDTPVKRYSSGMYVRLAFAVAAHLEPEILIVDEVLAVGDAEFQKKCLGKMKDVSGEGRTVLFVSHNMAAVKSLCTKALVLVNGSVTYLGQTSNAVSHYLLGSNISQNKILFDNKYNLEKFTLHEISLNAVGLTSDLILDEYQEIELNTKITIKGDQKDLQLTYVLNNQDGEPLFAFSHIIAGNNERLSQGYNHLVCKLPKGFLNIATYSLDIYIIQNSKNTIFLEKDIINFNIQEGEREIGSWMGREPGVIKPVFEWEILNKKTN